MVIVTGSNGFIGSALVWELNQSGVFDIICIDSINLDQRPEPLKKRTYSKFLLKDQIWNFLSGSSSKNIDWVIHLGACSSTTETNWDFLNENNTVYTNRLFDWCRQNGKNFIYASSAATYGSGENGFNDEFDSERLQPLNLYGQSKVLSDRWIIKQDFAPPHWYGLKFFNVFGPNEYHKENMASVVFKAYHSIMATGQFGLFKSHNPLYRDGEQMRDFIYVKDVTRWILELMYKKPKNGIYNMGFGKARTWKDLIFSVFSSLNKDPQINWLAVPPNIRDQYQYFTEANMTKWLSQKMSPPEWPLEKAVSDYVKNYLNQSDPWL